MYECFLCVTQISVRMRYMYMYVGVKGIRICVDCVYMCMMLKIRLDHHTHVHTRMQAIFCVC